MRLIDADALLEQYNLKDATKYGNKNSEQQAHSCGTLMLYEIADMIEDVPTAYDVDKVVDELKKQAEKYRNSEKFNEGQQIGVFAFEALGFEKSIKIVRAGGKE